jgi:hypothetical protein
VNLKSVRIGARNGWANSFAYQHFIAMELREGETLRDRTGAGNPTFKHSLVKTKR